MKLYLNLAAQTALLAALHPMEHALQSLGEMVIILWFNLTRLVFKICSVDPGRLSELQNLRTTRSNLTWSCADAKWNPSLTRRGIIATGSTNSQVVIWDVDSQVPTRPGIESVPILLTHFC